MSMATIHDNALYDIEELRTQLASSRDVVVKIRFLHELSGAYRRAAIAVLLAQADTASFANYLRESGRARVELLGLAQNRSAGVDRYRKSSLTASLLDALAAADMALARRIAELSPDAWLHDEEFEEDFCYAHVLHTLLRYPDARNELTTLIARFENVLDGQTSPQIALCKALLNRDQPAFNDAFDELIEERRSGVDEKAKTLVVQDETFQAERALFVEGLGLLQLAKLRGLDTLDEYPMMPSLASIATS